MLCYNEFYIAMIISSSLYLLYAYFISLIYDLKKCLYFFLQKVTVLEITFLSSMFCESVFTDTSFIFASPAFHFPQASSVWLCIPNGCSSLTTELFHGMNLPLIATLTSCPMLQYVVSSIIWTFCNYDFLFFDGYLKCETRAPSKLTSALFGLCLVLDAFPSNVIIF